MANDKIMIQRNVPTHTHTISLHVYLPVTSEWTDSEVYGYSLDENSKHIQAYKMEMNLYKTLSIFFK